MRCRVRRAGLRRVAGLSVGVIVGVVCLLWSAGGSWAARPLRIRSFSIRPTARTTPKLVVEGGQVGFEFVNEPYVPEFTQAGGRPWGLTTRFEFETEEAPGRTGAFVTREPKDVVVNVPPGLLGDPLAVPRCPLAVISSNRMCPSDTQVGYYLAYINGGHQLLAPVVSVTPEPGQSAEFAIENTAKLDTPLVTAHLVRTLNPVTSKPEYTLTLVSKDIPTIGLSSFELTFWGVPADPSHDQLRGMVCRVAQPDVPLPLSCLSGPEGGGVPSGLAGSSRHLVVNLAGVRASARK